MPGNIPQEAHLLSLLRLQTNPSGPGWSNDAAPSFTIFLWRAESASFKALLSLYLCLLAALAFLALAVVAAVGGLSTVIASEEEEEAVVVVVVVVRGVLGKNVVLLL